MLQNKHTIVCNVDLIKNKVVKFISNNLNIHFQVKKKVSKLLSICLLFLSTKNA